MKKFMAIVLATLLALSMVAVLVACDNQEQDEHKCAHVCATCGKCTNADCKEEACAAKCEGHTSTGPDATKENIITEANLANILGTGKLYVTSIGQSNDYTQVQTVLTNSKVGLGMSADSITVNGTLAAADVEAGSTVIVVIGDSAKGLGAAGVNYASEKVRAEAFAAAGSNINIIAMHVGGAARRGTDIDPCISTVFAAAKVCLYTADGNADGQLGAWAGTVPHYEFAKLSATRYSLGYLLGK